jgi:poly-gamma-glutamate synthesis protein (capsule biosynthesis protein)
MFRTGSAALLVILTVAAWPGRAVTADGQKRPAQLASPTAPAPAPAYTIALTGDSIITRKLSVYREPAFLQLIDLVRSADAAFTNLEMLFHDYEPYAMNESGGTYMRADPGLARDLVWAGFDLLARANNHAGDYGALGLRLTTQHVRAAGLVQAGVGDSLPEAREAKFLETPGGRVALISTASTFPDHARAGRSRGDVPPRPGLNPLRFTTKYVVTPQQLESLRGVAQGLGLAAGRGEGTELTLLRQRFVPGETPAVLTEPNRQDVEEIAAAVRNASRLADRTIVSMHGHESGPRRTEPAAFQVAFAHAMIDAGADLIVGSGPHVLRGIEIYKGRPIFYSLGDFIFQNETLLRLPSENYEPYGLGADAGVADFNASRYDNDTKGFPAQREIWESAVAVARWEGRRLREITLHPIALGFGRSASERGRPVLADAAAGGKILEDLVRLSSPLGTAIEVRDGIGRIVLPDS